MIFCDTRKTNVLSDSKIPADIHKFIVTNVDSVGLLEILAVMLKERNKNWTAQDLRNALHSSDQSIDKNLRQLLKIGAVACDEHVPKRYRYAPANENLDKLLMNLITSYMTFPMRVIEIIYNKSNEILRDFSDAFKIRKDPKDG